MDQIKTESWNGHAIRYVWKYGAWWAVAKDVEEALGCSNTRDEIRTHVEKIDKNTVVICDGIRAKLSTNIEIKEKPNE